jgi:predicted ATPase
MAIVNYMELTKGAMERALGTNPTAEEAVEWLFASGIADEGKARRAQIRFELSQREEQGESRASAAYGIAERHHLSAERVRAIGYDEGSPRYASKTVLSSIISEE